MALPSIEKLLYVCMYVCMYVCAMTMNKLVYAVYFLLVIVISGQVIFSTPVITSLQVHMYDRYNYVIGLSSTPNCLSSDRLHQLHKRQASHQGGRLHIKVAGFISRWQASYQGGRLLLVLHSFPQCHLSVSANVISRYLH